MSAHVFRFRMSAFPPTARVEPSMLISATLPLLLHPIWVEGIYVVPNVHIMFCAILAFVKVSVSHPRMSIELRYRKRPATFETCFRVFFFHIIGQFIDDAQVQNQKGGLSRCRLLALPPPPACSGQERVSPQRGNPGGRYDQRPRQKRSSRCYSCPYRP